MECDKTNMSSSPADNDASPSNNTDGREMEGASAPTADTYDKSQTLVDIANNTFRELCKSLESEQTKLLELEERRKKLQEEMLRLKVEIEEEKQFYHLNLSQSVSENLKILNSGECLSNTFNQKCPRTLFDSAENVNEIGENLNPIHLEPCYEVDETCPATARNAADDSKTLEEQTDYIKTELQSVLTQCISEQNNTTETQCTTRVDNSI